MCFGIKFMAERNFFVHISISLSNSQTNSPELTDQIMQDVSAEALVAMDQSQSPPYTFDILARKLFVASHTSTLPALLYA